MQGEHTPRVAKSEVTIRKISRGKIQIKETIHLSWNLRLLNLESNFMNEVHSVHKLFVLRYFEKLHIFGRINF